MMTGAPTQHNPRSAASVLTEALGYVHLIEPPGAREPIVAMLRATVELCVTSPTLLGKPVRYVMELAEALVQEVRP
jgi:hypothetical protein